jgi:transposase
MFMFNNTLLFTQALGLNDPWKVDKVEFNQVEGQLDLYISRKRGSKHPCPHCGAECEVHDTKSRKWRHLNFFQYRAYIYCDVPRIKCKEHGVVQAEVPWSKPGSGFTMLFEAFMIELAKAMPINTLAKLIGENDTRIWRVIRRYVEKARKEENFSEVTAVGIDETSSKKGHNYVSVFVDLDESRVIFATEGKDSKTVDSFKEDFKEHGGDPDKVENICCDMSPAFIKGTEENFTNADITFDKFHVMQAVNKAVDEVRRQEQTQNECLKNSRYIWLRNPENLTKKQKASLGTLSKMNLKTVRAYNIKLSLQEFWEIEDLDTAIAYLKKWYFWATHSRLEPIKQVAYLIKRHWNGIIQYISSRINNGILEGINSLIQATKRKARGYRNTQNLITIIYLTCSKLNMNLPKAFV